MAQEISKQVEQFPTFYALRPSWLASDRERTEFAERYPELVERFADCWPARPAREVSQEESELLARFHTGVEA